MCVPILLWSYLSCDIERMCINEIHFNCFSCVCSTTPLNAHKNPSTPVTCLTLKFTSVIFNIVHAVQIY